MPYSPYLFAAVAVFAVGFAIYELVSRKQAQKQRAGPKGPGRRQPPPSPPPSPPPRPKPKPKRNSKSDVNSLKVKDESDSSKSTNLSDSSKSTDLSDSSKPATAISAREFLEYSNLPECSTFGDTECSVRKRKLNTSNESTDTYHRNINDEEYEKNVYKKVVNDTTSAGKNLTVDRETWDSDSDSENNKSEKMEEQSAAYSDGTNNLSHSSDSLEEVYKQNIIDNLKNENIERLTTQIQDCRRSEIIDNVEHGLCIACEENPINVVAFPCGHRYLCLECSNRIFGIYDKCSICHADIENFNVI